MELTAGKEEAMERRARPQSESDSLKILSQSFWERILHLRRKLETQRVERRDRCRKTVSAISSSRSLFLFLTKIFLLPIQSLHPSLMDPLPSLPPHPLPSRLQTVKLNLPPRPPRPPLKPLPLPTLPLNSSPNQPKPVLPSSQFPSQ